MLTHISIKNFAIADQVELEIKPGMTTITGETGAGKSITLDALGLALGDRADSGLVRHGADRADIHATFDIAKLPSVKHWLDERDLSCDNECLLRRVISKEGRSRAYINGSPVTLNDIKHLGEQLIDIHSQHEHQSLLKKDTHRSLLDHFAGAVKQAEKVKLSYQQWHKLAEYIKALEEQNNEQEAKVQLLKYQIEEFDALALQENELEQLESEQKSLANAEQNLASGQQALDLCAGTDYSSDSSSLLDILGQAIALVDKIEGAGESQTTIRELMASAQINLEEAKHELQDYLNRFEVNPVRLQEVEDRLNSFYDIARKHRVKPQQLLETHQTLIAELEQIDCSEEKLAELHIERDELLAQYQQAADKLSETRAKSAKKLTKEVEGQLKKLGMQHCQFTVDLSKFDKPNPYGNENTEFLIAPNPGQPAQPMIKIASGGELSRISLAIQVVTAATSTTPTLCFDEVDVGIGGGTAEVVGNLLRQLGENAQVLCVTHQPQVASKGHQHWRVSKSADKQATFTQVETLSGDEQVNEIARMLGGIEITDKTREHAAEMLNLEAC